MMNRLMNMMMLSCVRATTLIEKKPFDGLNRTENLRLRLHTSMCDACRQYEHQSVVINHAIRIHLNNIKALKTDQNYKLTNPVRQRMQKEILKSM